MGAKIARIETFEVTIPLPKPLLLGVSPITARQYVFVHMHDDEGNYGTAYGLTRDAPIAATIDRLITPRWINRELDDHQTCYDNTVKGNLFMGTNGIFWRALSLVDCALYELLAKRTSKPLCEYLGGDIKVIPTTLAGCYPLADETPASLESQMHHMATYRPAGIKVTSSADFARDTQRLRICRQAIPNGPPLLNDLYCTAKDAESLLTEASQWADFNMLWLEDPFPFDDFENMAKLSAALPYPVGTGDEQSGIRHFTRLMDQGRQKVIRLDATVCGGVRAFRKIAELAAERGIPVSCHVFSHLHSQLAAAIPAVKWIEYMLPKSQVESIHLVWGSNLEWRDGGLLPANAPGVGYDWDEDALAYYREAN
jgi:L-alanine-DL-glutamate epimerase-like enolase superfamily enzyme